MNRAEAALLLALLCCPPVPAAAEEAVPDKGPVPAADPELLEFLGSFTTRDGEWVDPRQLAELDELSAESEQGESATSSDVPEHEVKEHAEQTTQT